jgi:hypothetical protein
MSSWEAGTRSRRKRLLSIKENTKTGERIPSRRGFVQRPPDLPPLPPPSVDGHPNEFPETPTLGA